MVNETAFELFVEVHSPHRFFPRTGQPLEEAWVEKAYARACQSILLSDGAEAARLDRLSVDEYEETVSLFHALEMRFSPFIGKHELVIRPSFKGCGIINSCCGDLCTKECLFEVKAGERPFRSADLRQILIYCTLMMREKGSVFENIELYNPRIGVNFCCSVEALCFEMSGKTASDLMFEIGEAISAAGVSV